MMRDLGQARRLETGLIGLRWFVVVLGGLQTYLNLQVRRDTPDYVVSVGFVLVAALVIGNVLITSATERATRPETFRSIGLAAFVLDIVVITGLVWTAGESPSDPTWVIAYLLPLEGAIRYRIAGALAPVAVFLGSEVLRELTMARDIAGHRFNAGAVATRVGIELVVALVAGLMARSLQREADNARERARLAEEAASREEHARRELAAFHGAILAGVASADPDGGLQSMAEAIGRDLHIRNLAILLIEDDADLVTRAVHGDPGLKLGDPALVEGVIGRALASGAAMLEDGGTEAAVPLRVGTDMIGVLFDRSEPPGSIDPDQLAMLSRLADQIALVVQAAQLRARQEETLHRLKELDEMKSDFVAITSHELRTPLAAVRGFVNTLRRRMHELPTDEVAEFLGIIDQQTDRLIRLVEDLLVVTRIEAGKIALHPEPTSPVEVLRALPQCLGDGGERVEIFCDPSLPSQVLLDPYRLGQVLINLLQNALKFSPAAEPVVLAARSDGASLHLSVTDHGVGIPIDEHARIFERFHQTDAASTRKAEGAGLGLYITRRLVEAMGGEIGVESEVGRGSTFTVRLPVTQAASPIRAPRSAAGREERTAS